MKALFPLKGAKKNKEGKKNSQPKRKKGRSVIHKQ